MRSIKTSLSNKEVVTNLTTKLQLGAENIIARIALSLSLSKMKKFDISDIKDSKGKEYTKNIFFGDYYFIYVSLVCQLYNINRLDPSIPKLIKIHLDDGLEILDKEFSDSNNKGIDYLLTSLPTGL
tara:strand:+ start:857 stop:1234 length:378 start_codon:yes stop_codon:yes gene_type:complete